VKLRDALANARRRPTVAHYAQFSEQVHGWAYGYLHATNQLPEDAFRKDLDAALQGRPAPGG
jgi:hypothetical protein